MFHNYQELFYGYYEFYTDSSWSIEAQEAHHQRQLKLNESHTLYESRSTNHTSCMVSRLAAAPFRLTMSSISSTQMKQTEIHLSETIRQNLSDDATDCCAQRLGEQGPIGTFNGLSSTDWLYIVTIFLNLLFMKRRLSKWIKSSNVVKSFGLRKKDQERLDESLWRLVYYTFSSSWLLYSCFLKHQAQRLFDKNAKFTEYLFGVDLDEYLICMIETGFYLHATYAIVFEDVWRRDSPMMLLHHVAAIFSVLAIYATRTHRIGLAAIVLRDTCDVLLEIGKIFLCLRIQHGKIIKSMDKSVKYMLAIFSGAFVINQLYYYPLFCLYHAFNLIRRHKLRTPSMTGILSCGLIFLILDLLWFCLILRLLFRMLLTNEPLKDLREYEDDDSCGEQEPEDRKLVSMQKKNQ